MLTAQTLNRVSASYARGYRDGYAGMPLSDALAPNFDRPFASYDYLAGHDAGTNDRRWDDNVLAGGSLSP